MRRILFLFAFILAGCSGNSGSSSSTPRFAVVSNNSDEFWTLAESGAAKAGKDFNCEVVFRKPEKGTLIEQRDILNALVNQGFDGISVSVINPIEQAADLKQIAGKMKLITMDNDAEGSDRICYIGTDNIAAGRSAGKLVARALPKGGTIGVFVGSMSALNAQQRFKGLMDELGEIGKSRGVEYTLYRNEPITDNVNPEQAAVNARQALEKLGGEPNVCLVGLWAYNPPALLEAAKTKGLAGKVKIVGFDEKDATLDGIKAGHIEGTVVQDPYNFAHQSIEILAAEKKGDTSKRAKTTVPHRIITADGKVPEGEKAKGLTAAEFKTDLDAKMAGK